MYSTHNEGKSVVAARFIRTLKNIIYKYITSISKNVHINKLGGIVNKGNNIYHRIIKMESVDIKLRSYFDFGIKNNERDPKFKVEDYVRIPKHKNISAKGYTPNRSEEVFVIEKVQNTVPWTYVIEDLNGYEIVGMFYEKELQKMNQR